MRIENRSNERMSRRGIAWPHRTSRPMPPLRQLAHLAACLVKTLHHLIATSETSPLLPTASPVTIVTHREDPSSWNGRNSPKDCNYPGSGTIGLQKSREVLSDRRDLESVVTFARRQKGNHDVARPAPHRNIETWAWHRRGMNRAVSLTQDFKK